MAAQLRTGQISVNSKWVTYNPGLTFSNHYVYSRAPPLSLQHTQLDKGDDKIRQPALLLQENHQKTDMCSDKECEVRVNIIYVLCKTWNY